MNRLVLLLSLAIALAIPVFAVRGQEAKTPKAETKTGEAKAGEAHAEQPAGAAKTEPAAELHTAPAGHAPAAGEHAAGEHAAGDHGGHAHDPLDLSEGNPSPHLRAAEELRFDLAIASLVVFLGLLAILTKFAWGPISMALDRREETIARQIEEAKLASEKASQQLKEYEVRLAAATDEARQIVAQARKDAELAKDKIVAEAREAAGKERDRAVADIVSAKNQALDEIAQRTVHTAISLAKNIIRREVKPQEHEALIGEAINEFSKLN
jgi:F-type H+-transporting ATPase subunit b